MEVVKVTPRGFCYGVMNAINQSLQATKTYKGKKIVVLGMIVHNQFVVNTLQANSVITLDYTLDNLSAKLDEVKAEVAILTAHGTRKEVYDILTQKNIIVVDTTCKDVLTTMELINQDLKMNHEVLYIGVKDHPEALASLALDYQRVHLVTSKDDVLNLHLIDNEPLIVNQTTISLKKVYEVSQAIKVKYPLCRFLNEQCDATRRRQEAIINLSNDIDLILVVGDNKSNNSNELLNLAKQKAKDAYLIDSLESLDISILNNKKKVAVTSGASTPHELTEKVINFLVAYNENSSLKEQK